MDKAQASTVADALMRANAFAHASQRTQERRRRTWSRSEWQLALLAALLGLVIGTAIAVVFQLPWSAIIFIAEFGVGLGMLAGCVAVGFHRVLTRRSSGRRYRSAA